MSDVIAKVRFISRLGRDAFGEIAPATWRAESIRTEKMRGPTAPGLTSSCSDDGTGEIADSQRD